MLECRNFPNRQSDPSYPFEVQQKLQKKLDNFNAMQQLQLDDLVQGCPTANGPVCKQMQ